MSLAGLGLYLVAIAFGIARDQIGAETTTGGYLLIAAIVAAIAGFLVLEIDSIRRRKEASEARHEKDREVRLASLRQAEAEADKLVGQIFTVVEVGERRVMVGDETAPYPICGTLTVSDGDNTYVWEIGEMLWKKLALTNAGDQLGLFKRQSGDYYSPEKVDERLQSERESRRLKGLAKREEPIDPMFHFLGFERVT